MSSITQAPSHKRSLLGLGLVAGLTAMGTAGIMYGLPQTLPPPPADPRLPLLARSLDIAEGATMCHPCCWRDPMWNWPQQGAGRAKQKIA